MEDYKINFDFAACEAAIKELDQVADLLSTELQAMRREDVRLIRSSWSGESGAVFLEEYLQRADRLYSIEKKLRLQIEDMKRTARKMYRMEQEAKRIASENEGAKQ